MKIHLVPPLPRSLFVAGLLSSGFVSSLYATDGSWTVLSAGSGSGNWNTGTNWSSTPTVPGGAGSVITIQNNITTDSTVTIDTASATVGSLTFGDSGGSTASNAYSIAASGGASLIFDNGASNATLSTLANSKDGQEISAGITLNSSLDITANGQAANNRLRLTGKITGVGGININAASAALVLNNSGNDFSGGVTLNSGARLSSAADTYLGSGDFTINGGTFVTSTGATLHWSGSTAIQKWNGDFTVNASNGTLNMGAAAVTLGGNRQITITTTVSNRGANVTSVISDGGNGYGLTLRNTGSQTGVLTLSRANTYTGATTVTNGILRANVATQAFGLGSAVSLANAADATLDLNGFSNTIGSLAGGGTTGGNVTLGAGTLTTGDTTNTSYGGIISGTGGLTKQGPGVFTLTGANAYTGATNINAGTLFINNTTGNSAVTVKITGTLGGSGTLTGATTANSGSFLSSGASSGAVGTLTFASTLDISGLASGTGGLLFDLDATAASDKITLSSGALTIGSGVLNLDDFSFVALGGYGVGTYTLFDTSASIVGTLGTNLTGTVGGLSAAISFANSNQDIVLTVTAVPEPSTYSAIFGALTLVGVAWRKRRHNTKSQAL